MGCLSKSDSHEIEAAVRTAESRTSAEIKVVVLRHCWGDIKDKARRLFHKHGLHETAERNAVMIMVVTANRQVLIYGDKGIHERVGEGYWVDVKDAMVEHFKSKDLVGGLKEGVLRVGESLVEYFPRGTDDVNELSDGVIHEG